MKWYKICTILLVTISVHADQDSKDKRDAGAETYVTASPKTTYVTATASPTIYATAAPGYTHKFASQQPAYVTGKVNYVPQQVSYEQQPQINYQQSSKLAYQQQAYNPQQNKYAEAQIYVGPQQFNYAYEPQQQQQQQYNFAQQGPKYVLAQPKYTYTQQPSAGKHASQQTLSKVAYAPVNVAYAAQPSVAQSQPHYSSAGSVSSFSFNSPHVSYSNLGVLSQALGKAYTQQQQPSVSHHSASAGAPQQISYAPASGTHYISNNAQQVAYSAAPQQHVQYSAAPQVQYVSAAHAPQVQFAPAQLQLVSPQGSHSSPQYVYAAPQVNYGTAVQKGQYATPGITYV